jgi:lipopolysaccharide biosynthesis regulator YciM
MIDKDFNYICEKCGYKDPVAFDFCPKCKAPSRLTSDYYSDDDNDDTA